MTNTYNGIQIPTDIRNDEEGDAGFIDTPYPESPIHFPLEKIRDPEGIEEFLDLCYNEQVILYDSSKGGRIFIVFEILTNESFNGTVYYIVGGIIAWVEAGFPIRNNTPPEAPEVNSPARGKKGVNITFKFVSDDLEGDYVYYSIDWGDNTTDEIGPYPSNLEAIITHIWYENGGYNIRCKATDTYGAESEWTEFLFWVVKSRTAYNSLIQGVKLFLIRFSIVF